MSKRVQFCFGIPSLVVWVCISSWSQQSPHTANKIPSFFVVVPGATKIKQSVFQGKDQITYRLQVEYPAGDVLEGIRLRLRQTGWHPLKEDWLNPGLPSSHVRGWTYFEDPTTKPATSVRAWNADWENGAHDILTYMLDYTCPDNLCSSTRNLYDLRVIAIRVPARLAAVMKSSLPSGKTGK
jgi:hypothetical protein